MTRLFLDTEWADEKGTQLVSLGLVCEDGQHRFYSEVSPLPATPTRFVRSTVYPLLEHGWHARQPLDLARDLRRFLSQFTEAEVIYDYPTDGTLFRHALSGFGASQAMLDAMPQVPPVRTTLLGDRHVIRWWIYRYFTHFHPELSARQHHALVDAEALRWAWHAITTHVMSRRLLHDMYVVADHSALQALVLESPSEQTRSVRRLDGRACEGLYKRAINNGRMPWGLVRSHELGFIRAFGLGTPFSGSGQDCE